MIVFKRKILKRVITTETKKCVSCGKEFTLSESELDFYRSKGLQAPKRCKDCREQKKERTQKKNRFNAKIFLPLLIGLVFAFCAFVLKTKDMPQKPFVITAALSALFTALFLLLVIRHFSLTGDKNLNLAAGGVKYRFRNNAEFKKHFKKHGAETGCKTPKRYIEKANRVIHGKNSVSKREKEDGDTVWFDVKTGEIVFLAKQGFIRSYYISDADYFERQ